MGVVWWDAVLVSISVKGRAMSVWGFRRSHAGGGRLLSVVPGCIGVLWCVCWLGCGMVGVEDS